MLCQLPKRCWTAHGRTNVLYKKPLILKEIGGFFLLKIGKKVLHFMSTAFILKNKVEENGVKFHRKGVKWRKEARGHDRHV